MRRSAAKEMMDERAAGRRLLEEDLANLRVINRRLGAYRAVLWGLRRFESPGSRGLSVLDVGTGSADLPAAIAAWGKKNRIPVRIVGLDLHPVTVAVARRTVDRFSEISIVCGDGLSPPFSPGAFDLVLSSQFLHHFSEGEIVALLRQWSRLALRGIVVSDLIRHPLAYCGISCLTRLFTRNEMTRHDAPLSVRRAFTLKEWGELFERAGIGPFRLYSFFPFRMLAVFPLEGG